MIGIGEQGLASLLPTAQRAVERAEVIVGGIRHPDLGPGVSAERVDWPEGFDELLALLRRLRPRRPVMLVTGDPLWYSIGARLLRAIPAREIEFHPQLSAFQWAACRLRWSLADVETLTVHGREAEQIVPYFWPGARLLVLTAGAESPGEIARLLSACGYGRSRITVLANLGGPDEAHVEGMADEWAAHDPVETMPPFHTLAIECAGMPRPLLPRLPGLAGDAFPGGSPALPREVRSLALALLMPARGAWLWDIGCGDGAIGIEWMRAAPEARAIGIDPDEGRLATARANALALGAPRLKTVAGCAPEALEGLPAPDAVFFGGGLSPATAEAALAALSPGGRLVACSRQDDGATLLATLHRARGGVLHRLACATVDEARGWQKSGPFHLWGLVI